MARAKKRRASPPKKKSVRSTEHRRRSEAAKRGWVTRRKKLAIAKRAEKRHAIEVRLRREDAQDRAKQRRIAVKAASAPKVRKNRAKAKRKLAGVSIRELINRVKDRSPEVLRQTAKMFARAKLMSRIERTLKEAQMLAKRRIEAHQALYARLEMRKSDRPMRERWHDLVDAYDLDIDYETWDDLLVYYH